MRNQLEGFAASFITRLIRNDLPLQNHYQTGSASSNLAVRSLASRKLAWSNYPSKSKCFIHILLGCICVNPKLFFALFQLLPKRPNLSYRLLRGELAIRF
ncbi:MAG: hypothetical protein CLLPBCKN_006442 [Chroococcidiopsis cubana SAG 39.79]|nr:hypothetical protein [Chroococcidiopsis cubana SAG 39.79]